MSEKKKSTQCFRPLRLTRSGRFKLLLGSGSIALIMLSFLACAPQTRHDVLSFFFDGVSEPNIRRVPPKKDFAQDTRTMSEFQEQMALLARNSTVTLSSKSPRDLSTYSANENVLVRLRVGEGDANIFHQEMERKKCLLCHDASLGLEPKIRFTAEFCDQCHEEKRKREGKLQDHGPYRMAHCFPCHNSGHTSASPEFFEKPPAEQCLDCHEKDSEKLKLETTLAQEARARATTMTVGVLPTLEGADRFETQRTSTTLGSFAHHQMEKDKCLICHNQEDGLKPVSEPTREFCDQCHGEKRKAEGWNHTSINLGDCRPCHTNGHESPYPKLLEKSMTETCLFCHQESEERQIPLHNIKALRVDIENCTACHDPHKVF